MMKIAIVGLVSYENFGDQIIGETVEYLVKQYGNVNTELIDFSLDGKEGTFLQLAYKTFRKWKWKRTTDWLLMKKYKKCYKRELFKRISDCDGIIFSSGSFKYGTQNLWAQYSVITAYADIHKIPVMFNAMNVQKADLTNFKCRYLRKCLDHACVKYFTSRDGMAGVERIKKDYTNRRKLKVYPAADPAFWIPETYNISRRVTSDRIGINVIAPNRFLMYGGTLPPEEVKKAYITMLDKLSKRGFTWQLFTNGMCEDNDFAFELANAVQEWKDERVRIPGSASELVGMVANYKAVFGARLHSMICAYSLGVPVSGIIWDEKIVHFAEMAKLENLLLSESEITGEAMFDNVMKSLQREDDSQNRDFWKNTTRKTIFEFLDNIKQF